MKKLHKILILAVVLAAVIGIIPVSASGGISAAVDAGVTDRLEAFGIITDKEKSAASEIITKAQFATMLMKACNVMPDFDGNFADVDEKTPDAGYISMANMFGAVTADGQGRFNPGESIKAETAVRAVMVMLGFDNILGQADDGAYVSYAAQYGISNGVTANAEGYMTYAGAMVLISNMLDTKNYVNVINSDTFEINSSDATAIEKFFGVEKIKVNVVSVNVNRNTVRVDVLSGYNKGMQTVYTLADYIEPDLIFGNLVFYVYADETVVYAGTKINEVVYDYIEAVNKDFRSESYFDMADIDTVVFKNSGEKYKLSDDAEIYFNDMAAKGSKQLINCFAKAVVVNDEIVKIEIYKLSEGGLIYRADEDVLKFSTGRFYENTWEGFSQAEDLRIIIDGTPNNVMTDLKTDMVFDYWKDGNGKFLIVASSRSIGGAVEAYSDEAITVNGEDYTVNGQFGVYSYLRESQKYIEDAEYSISMGTQSTIFFDDNQTVRFIRPDTEIEMAKTFDGLVISASDGLFEGKKLKIYRISDTQSADIYECIDNLDESEVSFAYAKSTAGAFDGTNFFRFKLNDDGKIIKISKIPYFGNVSTQNGSFDINWEGINGTYIGDSIIFVPLEIDGEYTVRMLTYYGNLLYSKTTKAISVISDYDIAGNPLPNYVMFADAQDAMTSNTEWINLIGEVKPLADSKYQITFVGGEKYTLTEDVVKKWGLKKNMIVKYYRACYFSENLISITSVTDLNGNSENWKTDTYSPGVTSGFYKADDILIRNDNAIQFMVDGKPSAVYAFADNGSGGNLKAYKYNGNSFEIPPRGRSNSVSAYIRPYLRNSIINIQEGADVWFSVKQDTNLLYVVDLIIYENPDFIN